MKKKPLNNLPLVERLGLGDRVWGLASGELTPDGKPMGPTAISELLEEEGHELSPKNLSAWIRKQKEKVKEDVRELLNDHLRKNLPADLDALELVEAVSLENAKRQVNFISHDVSVNEKVTRYFLETWIIQILDAATDQRKLKGITTQIIRQVGDWITERIDWMKVQRDERKVALTAIDMKLRYAAQLHGAGSGNVLIYGAGEGPADPATTPQSSSEEDASSEEPGAEENKLRKKGGNVVTFSQR
jgi:hypothetical protein